MNSHTYDYDYIDGNAAAGELSNIFAMDVTVAEGQCAHCGATKRFAEAHLYMQAPGVVARCAVCEHVLLRFVKARQRAFLDLRGMTCLILDTSQLQDGVPNSEWDEQQGRLLRTIANDANPDVSQLNS